MNSDRKPSRRGRGRSYNMEKIIDLYDEGYSYSEIASRMNIKSVQSLRHSVERFLRERERKWAEISDEMKRKSDEEKKRNRKIIQEQRRKMEPQLTGIMGVYADDETLTAFKQACDGLGFIYTDDHGIEKFYLPQSIPKENEGKNKGGYWYYFYRFGNSYNRAFSTLLEFDSMFKLREFLFAMGFYFTVERGDADGRMIEIYAMHESEGSHISRSIIANGYIRIERGVSLDEMRKSLIKWTACGTLNIDDINDIKIAHFDNYLKPLRDGLRNAGYHLRLHHDPNVYMEERGKSFILMDDYMIVVNRMSRDNILGQYYSLGNSPDEVMEHLLDQGKILALNEIMKYGTGKGMSYDEMYNLWIESIKSRSRERIIRELDPFFIPAVGDRGKLQDMQDYDIIKALSDISNGKIMLEDLIS